MAAAAAVVACAVGVAGAAAVTAPGPARASTALTWTRIYQASGNGMFSSIAAVSKRNIWAVGQLTAGGNFVSKPFIRHFDGSTWTPVTIPGAGMYASGVQATSASNVWVFGYTKISKYDLKSGAYRWDGEHWHKIPFPAGTELQGAVVLGPSNVWAFGTSSLNGDVFHWNGHTWKPYDLRLATTLSMSASSSSNVWLTGTTWVSKTTQKAKTYRWNGSRWLGVSAPRPVVSGELAVLALSPANVWLGWDLSNGVQGKAAHWNGHTWTTLTTPANIGANTSDMVPDGRGGYWFGPMTDWTGKTWISGIGFAPQIGSGGFYGPARIPGTTTFLLPAGFGNPGSTVTHPAIYRLTLG